MVSFHEPRCPIYFHIRTLLFHEDHVKFMSYDQILNFHYVNDHFSPCSNQPNLTKTNPPIKTNFDHDARTPYKPFHRVTVYCYNWKKKFETINFVPVYGCNVYVVYYYLRFGLYLKQFFQFVSIFMSYAHTCWSDNYRIDVYFYWFKKWMIYFIFFATLSW